MTDYKDGFLSEIYTLICKIVTAEKPRTKTSDLRQYTSSQFKNRGISLYEAYILNGEAIKNGKNKIV